MNITETISQYRYNRLISYRLKEMNYAIKPEKNDTICRQQISRVNSEIKMRKKIFCMPTNMNCRFKSELTSVIADRGYEIYWDTIAYGLVKKNDTLSDCYCAHWINHNIQLEGRNFRNEIFKAADDKYVQRIRVNKEIVNIWHLDDRPYIKATNEKQKYYTYKLTENDSLCSKKYQWIDSKFTIEKNATITNVEARLDKRNKNINPSCGKNLLDYLEKQLIKDQWQPGKIRGENVRTEHHARIYITK